jgi:hypothetical protein
VQQCAGCAELLSALPKWCRDAEEKELDEDAARAAEAAEAGEDGAAAEGEQGAEH